MSVADFAGAALALVRENRAWAAPVCFALSFAESLAFVSIVVPSSIILVALGGLVPAAGFNLFELVGASALGAALGDWFSYWLGRRFKDRVATMWPFGRNPGLLLRGRLFFGRWGVWGIFLGRFLGPLRATVPIIAGMCAMPVVPFQIANFASAVVWAFAMLGPGALGSAWLGRFG